VLCELLNKTTIPSGNWSRANKLEYTRGMASSHQIYELLTGRDAPYKPEAAAHLFSTLPKLRDRWWWKLVGQHERVSFEIVTRAQATTFYLFAPQRLSGYLLGLLTANYPDVLVAPEGVDPLAEFAQGKSVRAAEIVPSSPSYLPLRSYTEFGEADPLASLLSTLSQLYPEDQVAVQFLLRPAGEGWKSTGTSLLESQPAHPRKVLIERKLAGRGVEVSIRILVASSSQERTNLLLETISTSLQAVSQSDGNGLVRRESWFRKSALISAITKRSWGWWSSTVLTLEELATLYHLPNIMVAHIPNLTWGKHLSGEPPAELPIVTSGMPAAEKGEINPFARTLFKNELAVYGLKRADRRRHLYVIGKTGTGKSTMLANMAINDLKNNEGLCVIDPHGDLVETLLNYIPSHRINDVIYFDPADPERTVKINLFDGENVVHRELIASGIVSVFQKLYAYSWGPRLEHILRNSLLTLLKTPQAKLSDIVDLLTNPKFRAKVLESMDDDILRNFWTHEFDALPDRQRHEAIAPILNKVGQFVSSPLVRDVVNAPKSSFSIEDIMAQGKILVVNLSQGRLGEDNATLLGAMLITKIQLAAMARVNVPEEERRDFYLYVDEFQNFATESFNKILSEARKYRLNLILANQYIAQIPEEVQKAIFGNCGSMISFVMGADDASVFTKEYGDKYTHDDLVSLGKYQIINKIAIDNIISRPFPAHTLPLAKSSNQNRDKVIKVSRERWAKKK
jgi:hypothetical protein